MATTNLALDTINASDYVDPEVFNKNYEKIDKLGVDYVIEEGTSGEWWYRKWKSGRAECGIDSKQFSQITLSKHSSGSCNSTDLSFGAYPFSFASRPYAVVTFEGDSGDSTRGAYIAQRHTTSTTMSPSFFIVDWKTNSMTPLCGIFVCGRYAS